MRRLFTGTVLLAVCGLLLYLVLEMRRDVARIEGRLARIESGLIAGKTQEIAEGARTDQERCLRVARWVAGHISNRLSEGSRDFDCFSSRAGLCGARSELFVAMLDYLHIPARLFNIYNFGRVGGGHSCAQAYYDGGWHFFDVTYAGVFMRGGRVLSWDEVRRNPEGAMKGLVVFEENLDRHGATSMETTTRARVDNTRRMHSVYTPGTIREAASFGFVGSPEAKTLHASVDASRLTSLLTIGKRDRDHRDVNDEGMRLRVSERLGDSLGTRTDTFRVSWDVANARKGAEYVLRYRIYRATKPDLAFWARGRNAEIVSGEGFETWWPLVLRWPSTWEIRFRPASDGSCSVLLGYDFRERAQAYVDQIEFGTEAD